MEGKNKSIKTWARPTKVVTIPQQQMSVSQSLVIWPWASITALQRCPFAVHKLTYCLLRHGIPAFSKGPQVIEVVWIRVTSLYTVTQLIPEVFYRIQVWRKHRLLQLRYPSLKQPFPNNATLMNRTIFVHADEIRPLLFMLGHNGLINGVIQVVWARRCAIHSVQSSSLLTRHTYTHCNNNSTTKGSSDDNNGWCIALSLTYLMWLLAVIFAQRDWAFIREQHWGPLAPRPM